MNIKSCHVWLVLCYLLLICTPSVKSAHIASGKGRINIDIIFSDNNTIPSFVKRERKQFVRSYRNQIYDSSFFRQRLNDFISTLHNKGFLEASVDSLCLKSKDSLTTDISVFTFIGTQYRLKQISWNIPSLLGEIDQKFPHIATSGYSDIQQKTEKETGAVLNFLENNGYPFAEVYIDSLFFSEKKDMKFIGLSARILPHTFAYIDSVIVLGETKEKYDIILRSCNLKKGEPYNHRKIRNIPNVLNNSPYFSNSELKKIDFLQPVNPGSGSLRTRLSLSIKERKSNQMDGILGFQPDPVTKKNIWVGNFKLKLANPVGKGKTFSFFWERPASLSQKLELEYTDPFFMFTYLPVNLGFNFAYNLFKSENLYLQREARIKFVYPLSVFSSSYIFYRPRQTILLDTKLFADPLSPTVLDSKLNLYGLGYAFEKLDNRMNPSEGWSVGLTIGIGVKDIKKNSSINPEVYQKLEPLHSLHSEAEGNVTKYFEIFLGHVIQLRGLFGIKRSEYLGLSDVYRLGGLRSVRGFDQDQFLSDGFAIGNIEYHYILEENSYFMLFADISYIEKKFTKVREFNRPAGIGAGLSYETRIGILTVSYALGAYRDRIFPFSQAKLHFGFLNHF